MLASGTNVRATTDLTTMTCGQCSGIYAIAERYRKERERDGDGWTCPYCKRSWGYFGNGETDRLKREAKAAADALARERAYHDQTRADRDAKQRKLSAAKGRITRIKNRVGNGVCPCCNRTFTNLARHMHSQHPDFTEPAHD